MADWNKTPHRSGRHPKEVLAVLDFADDIALLSNEQAKELLIGVKADRGKVFQNGESGV